jgi:hypothetical protein
MNLFFNSTSCWVINNIPVLQGVVSGGEAVFWDRFGQGSLVKFHEVG